MNHLKKIPNYERLYVTVSKLNQTRGLRESDYIEIYNMLQYLSDMGFSIEKFNGQYDVGSLFVLEKKLNAPEFQFHTSKYEESDYFINTDPLDIDEIVKDFEKIETDSEEMDRVKDACLEVLDRIEDSIYKLIYFELTCSISHRPGYYADPKSKRVMIFFKISR